MILDPRWSVFLSIFLSVLAFLAGAGGQFTDLGMTPVQAKAVLALITLFLGCGTAINAVLAAIPSKPNDPNFYLGPKVKP